MNTTPRDDRARRVPSLRRQARHDELRYERADDEDQEADDDDRGEWAHAATIPSLRRWSGGSAAYLDDVADAEAGSLAQ